MGEAGDRADGRRRRRSAGAARSERILAAAADLFRRHGFHVVGIDEIGAAAGITGPGVYRHFPTKDALLIALLDRAADALLAGARRIVADADDARDALRGLVRFHIRFALEERALLAVYFREGRSVGDEGAGRRLRRTQRVYLEEWVQVLGELRPELEGEELRVAASAGVTLLNAPIYFHIRLDRTTLERRLEEMALAALLAPDRAADVSNRSLNGGEIG